MTNGWLGVLRGKRPVNKGCAVAGERPRTLCWRMGWDSNPRRACTLGGFQDRCLQPLGHPSLPAHDAFAGTPDARLPLASWLAGVQTAGRLERQGGAAASSSCLHSGRVCRCQHPFFTAVKEPSNAGVPLSTSVTVVWVICGLPNWPENTMKLDVFE